MPVDQTPIYEPVYGQDKGRASRKAECQDSHPKHHRTEHKGHTPSPRIDIKIPEPAGKRNRPGRRTGKHCDNSYGKYLI